MTGMKVFLESNYLNILHGAKRPEELPENVLLCLRGEVVYKDAPARPVHGGRARQDSVTRQQVTSEWGVPETDETLLSI